MNGTNKPYGTEIFEENEAEVRSYCRSFPTVFTVANGATLKDAEGEDYIDFLAGAGVLNYGHNNPSIKSKVMQYLMGDGIVHSLDMYTTAKHDFMETLYNVILKPRGMDYKVTFPGPTGTNAVETALKFARKATGRHNVIAFTNAFHGMTQGSLSLTGNRNSRTAAGVQLAGVTRMPFDGYLGEGIDTADYLDRVLSDGSSGVDMPAAIIVETVQSEGGINVASFEWLKRIEEVARKHDVLFIIDDIQTGCGRTGKFFSFEDAGVTPDLVCLSKSLGGMGLPMSLVLFRPDLDVLNPGQHNGTFRGHNLAFVAAAAALDLWRDPTFENVIQANARTIRERLEAIVEKFPGNGATVRGRGMMVGISWDDPSIASKVSKAGFARKLIIETCGAEGQVLKLLPPLTITEAELAKGLDALEAAVAEVAGATEYSDAA